LFHIFSLEFKENNDAVNFLLFLVVAIPSAILLTLTGTISKRNNKEKKSMVVGATVFCAFVALAVMLVVVKQVSFGVWINEAILYRNLSDKHTTINQQVYSVGALGTEYNRKRVVQLKPILVYFFQVKNIDTFQLDKKQWLLVNEEVGTPYP
jgi:hypothetical protein